MGLYEQIVGEPVRSLNLRPLVAVGPETPVREVVARLRAERLGCATVVDPDGRPRGLFTENALAHAIGRGETVLDDPVGGHLEPLVTVSAAAPIARALELMQRHATHFVCITDDQGRATALTGQRGLMECVAEYFPKLVQRAVRRVGADSIDGKREGA